MRLVVLTRLDGRALYVNPDRVSAVYTLDGSTNVEMDAGIYPVAETEGDVARLLISKAPLVSGGPTP
jgi:hypothetical protein